MINCGMTPRLVTRYRAYLAQMDSLASCTPDVRCLRHSAAKEALKDFFEEVEKVLKMSPYKPWMPKEKA